MSSRLLLYDSIGHLRRYVAGPIDVKLEVRRRVDERDGMEKPSPTLQTKPLYVSVTASNQRIYALFCGRKLNEPSAGAGNEVHVFDWTGLPLGSIRLSEFAQSIAIDTTTWRLWAVSGEDGLSYYDLDRIEASSNDRR